MRTVTRLTWGSAKLWLGAVVVVAAALAVTRDSTPTHAVNPEILPSLSATTPTYTASALLVKGGQVTSGNSPCIGDTDPTTLCLRIWAKGVNNTTGASAFQIHYLHPTDKLQVSAVNTFPTWLASTGRQVACPAGFFQAGEGIVECNTLLNPPPYGATGNGLLASIAVVSRNVTGLATFTLATGTQGTLLVDTPPNPDDNAPIPSTVRSINIVVAPCADFDNTGRITVSDILFVVQKYNTTPASPTWYPAADLDGSGRVTVSDILISVQEFSMLCTV